MTLQNGRCARIARITPKVSRARVSRKLGTNACNACIRPQFSAPRAATHHQGRDPLDLRTQTTLQIDREAWDAFGTLPTFAGNFHEIEPWTPWTCDDRGKALIR